MSSPSRICAQARRSAAEEDKAGGSGMFRAKFGVLSGWPIVGWCIIFMNPVAGNRVWQPRVLWRRYGFLFPGVDESSVLVDAGVLAGTLLNIAGSIPFDSEPMKSFDWHLGLK